MKIQTTKNRVYTSRPYPDVYELHISLKGVLPYFEEMASLSSVTDFSARLQDKKTVTSLAKAVKKCAEFLEKKHAEMEKEEISFFASKGITTQEELLNFYSDDPDQIAAYFVSYSDISIESLKIEINLQEVYDWLVARASDLSPDTLQAVQNTIYPEVVTHVTISVKGVTFTLNRLLAAAKSNYFKTLFFFGEKRSEYELKEIRISSFEHIARIIQAGTLPRLFDEKEFFLFLEHVNFFDFNPSIKSLIFEDVISRYGLHFEDNTLFLYKLTPILENPFFLTVIQHVKLVEHTKELLDFAATLNLKSLTIDIQQGEDVSEWASSLEEVLPGCILRLKGDVQAIRGASLKCKVELVEASDADFIAHETTNLINFRVSDPGQLPIIPKLRFLQHLEVKNLFPSELLRSDCLMSLKINFLDEEWAFHISQNFPRLQHLSATGAMMTKKGFLALAQLEHLVELELPFSSLIIEGMQQLEKLTLWGKINGEELMEISQLPHLKVLDISRCSGFSLEDAITVAEMETLDQIHLPTFNKTPWRLGNFLNKTVHSRTNIII